MSKAKKPSVYSLEQAQAQMRQDEEESEGLVGQRSVQITKQQRIKATFYLNPEDIVAIDQIQTARFRRSRKKPERSHIVSEAIQSLFREQNG